MCPMHHFRCNSRYTLGASLIHNTKMRIVRMWNVLITTLHTGSDTNLWQKHRGTKEFWQLTLQREKWAYVLRLLHTRCNFLCAINSDENILFWTAVCVISKSTQNANITRRKSEPFIFRIEVNFSEHFNLRTKASANHDGCAERTSRLYPITTI